MKLQLLPYLTSGDPLTLSRWRWIEKRLPETRNEEALIDVGCGSGAFTIGAALRGYAALGLSWDRVNQEKGARRARSCGVGGEPTEASWSSLRPGTARFEILDVRELDRREELRDSFDFALCFECAEHILDDLKLFRDICAVLRPGGRLLFSSPQYYYRPLSAGDLGPFCKEETGWHVRRGYSPAMVRELCRESGLLCEEISYCGGFFAQRVTALTRSLSSLGHRLAWAMTLPLRTLAAFDHIVARISGYPSYSICLVAVKPRYSQG